MVLDYRYDRRFAARRRNHANESSRSLINRWRLQAGVWKTILSIIKPEPGR